MSDSRILTTDNLDAIKRYIDEQDQEIAQACYDTVLSVIQDDIKNIPDELDNKYSKSLSDLNKLLDTELSADGAKSNRLNRIESSINTVDNILDIGVDALNTSYSKTIDKIQKDIKNIQQYGAGSVVSGVNPEKISEILNNNITTDSTLTTNAIFGAALLKFVNSQHSIDGGRIKGVLNVNAIPALSADIITSKKFSVDRIPSLPISKIDWASGEKFTIKNVTISDGNIKGNLSSANNEWQLNSNGSGSIVSNKITWTGNSITIDKNHQFINWSNVIDNAAVEQKIIDSITANVNGITGAVLKSDYLGKHTYVDAATNETVTHEFGSYVDDSSTDKYTVMDALTYETDVIKNDWIGSGIGPDYNNNVADLITSTQTEWIGTEFTPTYDKVYDPESKTEVAVRTSSNVNDEFNKLKQAIDFQIKYNDDSSVSEYYSQDIRDIEDLLETNKYSEVISTLKYPNRIESISDVIGLEYKEDRNNIVVNVKSNRLDDIENNIGVWNKKTDDDTITVNILKNIDDINAIKLDVLANSQDISTNNALIVGSDGLSTQFNKFKEEYVDDSNLLETRLINDEEAIKSLQATVTGLNGLVNTDALTAQLKNVISKDEDLVKLLATKDDLNKYLAITDAIKTYLSIENYNNSIKNYYNKTESDVKTQEALKSYYTKTQVDTALSSYIKTTTANSTYLTKATADSTYLTQAIANSGYLTKNDASTTYLAKNDISPSISASGNNIKISVGGKSSSTFAVPFATSATKATQDGSGNVITSTYLTKSDASNKYVKQSDYEALQTKYNSLKSSYDDLLARVVALEKASNQTT